MKHTLPILLISATATFAQVQYAFTNFVGMPFVSLADGLGDAARFYGPEGLALDSTGNIYVADSYNNAIRKITPNGAVTTVAGSAGQDGSNDGIGSEARFEVPRGVAVDSVGNIYVADTYNHTIRKITPAGVVTT